MGLEVVSEEQLGGEPYGALGAHISLGEWLEQVMGLHFILLVQLTFLYSLLLRDQLLPEGNDWL